MNNSPITGAAIKSAVDGVVFSAPCPGRHDKAIGKMADAGYPTPVQGIQGFVNEQGEFLDRMEAAKLALSSGQAEKLHWGPELYSEDLWDKHGNVARLKFDQYGNAISEWSVTLTDYLTRRLGHAITDLPVISAVNTPGKLLFVMWNKFPSGCSLENEIDLEKSWAHLQWESKNYVDIHSVDQLKAVIVA